MSYETDKAREAVVEIKKFTPETLRALENLGYTIFELTGKSLQEILEDFKNELRILVEFYEMKYYRPVVAVAERSMRSQVAIMTYNLYLDEGFNRPNQVQDRVLTKRLKALKKAGLSNIALVKGHLSDYLELAEIHRSRNCADLFHDVYGQYVHGYLAPKIQAKSDIPEIAYFLVGHSCLGREPIWISVHEEDSLGGGGGFIAPLVIPQ